MQPAGLRQALAAGAGSGALWGRTASRAFGALDVPCHQNSALTATCTMATAPAQASRTPGPPEHVPPGSALHLAHKALVPARQAVGAHKLVVAGGEQLR